MDFSRPMTPNAAAAAGNHHYGGPNSNTSAPLSPGHGVYVPHHPHPQQQPQMGGVGVGGAASRTASSGLATPWKNHVAAGEMQQQLQLAQEQQHVVSSRRVSHVPSSSSQHHHQHPNISNHPTAVGATAAASGSTSPSSQQLHAKPVSSMQSVRSGGAEVTSPNHSYYGGLAAQQQQQQQQSSMRDSHSRTSSSVAAHARAQPVASIKSMGSAAARASAAFAPSATSNNNTNNDNPLRTSSSSHHHQHNPRGSVDNNGNNGSASAASAARNSSVASAAVVDRAASVQGTARAMTPISAAPSHLRLQHQYQQKGAGGGRDGNSVASGLSISSHSRSNASPQRGGGTAGSVASRKSAAGGGASVASGATGTASTTTTTRLVASLKVKAIDFLRRALLPVHHRGDLTRDDMVVVCSTVCKEFIEQSGYSDEALAETSSTPLAKDDEVLLTTLMLTTLKDLSAIKASGSAAPTPTLLTHSGGNVTHQTVDTQTSRVVTPQASIKDRARHADPNDPHHYHQPDDADGSHHMAGQQQQQQQLSTSIRGGAPLFQSVSYTISGVFPRGVNNSAYRHHGGRSNSSGVGYTTTVLRATLTSPTVQDADVDTIVMGSVNTTVPVALTWWLAYGPQRTVLNLDKMYGNGAVATYQISDSSFILSFKAGALVAGWDYSVYLSVTTLDGTAVSAVTTFVIPSLSGDDAAANMSADMSAVMTQEAAFNADASRRRGALLNQTRQDAKGNNPYTARTRDGYYGDADINADEYLSRAARFGPPSGYGGGAAMGAGGGDTPTGGRGGGGGGYAAADPTAQPLLNQMGEPVGYDVYQGSATTAPRYGDVVRGKLRDAMGGTSGYYDQLDYDRNNQRHEAIVAAQREHDAMMAQYDGYGDEGEGAADGPANNGRSGSYRTGSAAASTSGTNRNGPMNLAKLGIRGQINPYYVPPVAPMGPTYQEQLRHFFIDQIEPLYYLSPNPAMPEEAFKGIVKNVARHYWFAYDKSQPLSDALKREIIDTIKSRISHSMLLPPKQREQLYDMEKARAEEEMRRRREDDEMAADADAARRAQRGAGDVSSYYNNQPQHQMHDGSSPFNTQGRAYAPATNSSYYGITGGGGGESLPRGTMVSGGYQ